MTPVEKHQGTQLLKARQENSERKNVAGTHCKGPCNNAQKCEPPVHGRQEPLLTVLARVYLSLKHIQPHETATTRIMNRAKRPQS